MPMLADRVDAVVGVDTHRDTHEAEIAEPTGAPIATQVISNHTSGYAELVAWIVDHAPGPRVVVAVEGTRSYGAGLTRARDGRRRTLTAVPGRRARSAGTRSWPPARPR